jgi:hypothetical protein
MERVNGEEIRPEKISIAVAAVNFAIKEKRPIRPSSPVIYLENITISALSRQLLSLRPIKCA